MARSTDSDYFVWLCDRVEGSDYTKLLKKLYSIDYKPDFVMDGNRTAAGLNLRRYFCYEFGVDPDDLDLGECSVLEMLQGLAGSIWGMMGDKKERWFWELIENLDLLKFSDDSYSDRYVDERIKKWLRRQFSRSGSGSPFPLKKYKGDARNLEMWALMNLYLNEKYPV